MKNTSTSALSLFSLLLAVVLAPFWGSTVWPTASVVGAVCWGVGALLVVAATQFLNSLLEIDQTAFFNYQGTSSGSFLYGAIVTFGIMGLPFALAVGAGVETTLLVVVGLGTVGLLTVPVWTRGLGRVFHGQRHAMASGFRDE